jgi:hypothetical protein
MLPTVEPDKPGASVDVVTDSPLTRLCVEHILNMRGADVVAAHHSGGAPLVRGRSLAPMEAAMKLVYRVLFTTVFVGVMAVMPTLSSGDAVGSSHRVGRDTDWSTAIAAAVSKVRHSDDVRFFSAVQPHGGAVKGRDSRGSFTVTYYSLPSAVWGYVTSDNTFASLAKGIRVTSPGFVLNPSTLRLSRVLTATFSDTSRGQITPMSAERSSASRVSRAGRDRLAISGGGEPIDCQSYSVYDGSTGHGGPDVAYPYPDIFSAIGTFCYFAATYASAPAEMFYEQILLGASGNGAPWGQADENSSRNERLCANYAGPASANGTQYSTAALWSNDFVVSYTDPGYTLGYNTAYYGEPDATSSWVVGFPSYGIYNNDHAGFTCS